VTSIALKPYNNKLLYSFYALMLWLPLPLGSNRDWAVALMTAWACGLLLWWLDDYRQGQRQVPGHFHKCKALLYGLLAFQAVLLLQITPLPEALVAMISPQTASAYALLLPSSNWITLSVDASVTAAHLLQGLGFCAIAALTLLLIDTRKHLKILAMCLLISGLLQAAYGAFMTLSGIEYGFLIPKTSYIGNATGTFVNRNHYADYLTLCLAAGTGLLLADLYASRSGNWRERGRRIINALLGSKAKVRISLAIMVIALVLSHSRMGNTAFFFSLAGCGFVWLILTKRMTRGAIFLLCSLIVIDMMIVGAWFGMEKVKERLQGSAFEKETRDEVIRDTLPIVGDYWLVGSGAGSYYGVFSSYRDGDINGYYDHTHNDYLELSAEHGLLGMGILGFIVFGSLWQSIQAMRLRKSNIYKGLAFAPLMATTALIMHSLTDFNLQIPANAATYIVLLAMGWLCRFLPNKDRKAEFRASRRKFSPA
jgi:hypothetical protein